MGQLITRFDAIKSVANEYNRRKAWEEGGLKLAWIEKAINDTPDADARENILAEWIEDGVYQYRCSNCGEVIRGDNDCTRDINKFCWNCGADMSGKKKAEANQ